MLHGSRQRAAACWRASALGALIVVSGLTQACSDSSVGAGTAAAAGDSRVEQLPGVSFRVPTSWTSGTVTSSMRLGEYKVPGAAGEASLVLFRFPGGGSAQANLARWVGQFKQADGSSSEQVAKSRQLERDGLVLTELDVRGNYEGQQMPGAPAQPPIQSARLLALVVEGKGSPIFLKLQGPDATVTQWEAAWADVIASIAVTE